MNTAASGVPSSTSATRTSLFAVLGWVILCARFFQGLRHAELWGDDGWTFYPDAYAHGVRCLAWPVSGYLNSAQRLGALLAVWIHLPVLWVPTFFALLGLGTQLIVASYLISGRLASLWPDWKSRTAFAMLYLALPNSFEIFGTLTNVQWHLALLAFMIVMAPRPASAFWSAFEFSALGVSCLSGPFCLVLLPFAVFMLWHGQGKPGLITRAARLTTVVICAAVQLAVLMQARQVRAIAPLGASMTVLARMVALKVVIGLCFGLRFLRRAVTWQIWQQHNWPAFVLFVLALLLLLFAFLRGHLLARAFLLFCIALFAAELISPVVSSTSPQWVAMTRPLSGDRYFFLPMLGLSAALFVLARQGNLVLRSTALFLLALVVVIAIPYDFFALHLGQTNFDAQARLFATAPAGTRVEFPEHPSSERPMVLVKKAD